MKMRKTLQWAGLGLVAVLAGLAYLAISRMTRPIPGVQMVQASIPDPGQKPLAAYIWYPEDQQPGIRLPLIAFSHGTGGSGMGHTDTATALAQAGFVVVAMDHTGDNYRDIGNVGKGAHLVERPRHISRTLDYMLGLWPQRAMIDPTRIGMFGHSAGGFTALVIAGANPDLSRGATYCREHPERWTCQYVRRNGLSLQDIKRQATIEWHHDPRVKAIAIAAPAVGYAFDRANIVDVKLPVQLWAAGRDDVVDDSAQHIGQELPRHVDYHELSNAGHYSFLMPCNAAMHAIMTVMYWTGTEPICTDPAGFDRVAFHLDFNLAIVRFFNEKLRK